MTEVAPRKPKYALRIIIINLRSGLDANTLTRFLEKHTGPETQTPNDS